MSRILVINVNWLGDVIFSSPIFRALRQQDPAAHIACMAVPRVREILECIPEIDEIIPYDESGKDKGVGAKLRWVRQLKNGRFDTAYFLSRSMSRAILIRLAGIPERIGYENKGRGRLLTRIVPEPEQQVHRSDYYLNVVESSGVVVRDRRTYLQPPPDVEEQVAKRLAEWGLLLEEPKIVFNPGGNWDLKRWPKESFARLIDYVAQRKKARLIITGAEKDQPLAAEICALMKSPDKPLDITGKLTLKQLVVFLRHSDIFISADSGPLHIASSVGTHGIGIFGPTRPEWTGPRGQADALIMQRDVGCNRQPCYYQECPDNTCMQAVTVDDVFSSIQQIQSS